MQSGQVCCHYRSRCVAGGPWSALPALLDGASWDGHTPPPPVGRPDVLYNSPPAVLHLPVAAATGAAPGVGGAPGGLGAAGQEPVGSHLHHPRSLRAPAPTRPAPRPRAPLAAGTRVPSGDPPLPRDVPQTFAPLGTTSDSDIAKTSVMPGDWHHRPLYKSPTSWIRSQKAQFFRERQERQRKSEP